jgi:hypothetical protein
MLTRSAIIQEVERMHAAELATMAYYYFDFRDVKKQYCDGLLSFLPHFAAFCRIGFLLQHPFPAILRQ